MKKKSESNREDYCPFIKRDCTKCTFYWEKECLLKREYIIRSKSNG